MSLGSPGADFGGYSEIYLEVGYFKEYSSDFNQDIFFTYALGVNLSFEKFLSGSRSFLIPIFGLKTGGLFINNIGHGLLIEPTLGLVIYYGKHIIINLEFDFFLNSSSLSEYLGLGAFVTVNFNI